MAWFQQSREVVTKLKLPQVLVMVTRKFTFILLTLWYKGVAMNNNILQVMECEFWKTGGNALTQAARKSASILPCHAWFQAFWIIWTKPSWGFVFIGRNKGEKMKSMQWSVQNEVWRGQKTLCNELSVITPAHRRLSLTLHFGLFPERLPAPSPLGESLRCVTKSFVTLSTVQLKE